MSSQIETMQKLLEGLYEEVEENESKVRKEGHVSSDFCDICDRKRWEVIPFTPQEQKTLNNFYEWAQEYKIVSIDKSNGFSNQLEIRSKKQIIKGSRPNSEEKIYKYYWNVYDTKSEISKEMGKIRGLKKLFRNNSISFCPHFNQEKKTAIKWKLINHSIYRTDNESILIGCDDCVFLKKNTLCDSVYKDGFLYSFSCSFENLLIKQRIEKMGLSAETGERERPSEMINFFPYGREDLKTYYFRDLDVLLITMWEKKETIKHLNPSLLVILSDHTSLYRYLEYDTNILFYDKDGFYLYDKERKVETEIAVICDTIISDLNKVMDGLRGNDHDRTISALNQIGAKMGYVPKTEFSQPGVRIDLVWYDRKGSIQVACEVETSSTWKKDLISTWEVEPRLAIIVGFAKTDRVAKNLMSITLMKYVPHQVLYINKYSGNVFLFEKNSLIKSYKLKSEASEKDKEIKVI